MVFTSLITTAGQSAAANAAAHGYKIDLVRFKLSDTVITETDPSIIRGYTELPGVLIYDSGNNPVNGSLKYEKVNDTDVVITVFLHSDIGPFTFGSVGLYLSDGTLFTVLQLSQTYPKTVNTVTTAGNNYAFPFVFTLTLQDVLNLSILPENAASLPIVADEATLPSYLIAPYSNYFIQNYAGTNKSAVACRTANEWQFILASNSGLSEGWLHVDSSLFDSNIDEGTVVYYNYTTNKWSKADGEDPDIKIIGIKHGDGVRSSSYYFKSNAFVQGTDYFCNTSPGLGQLVAFSTRWYIGTAVSNSVLKVDPQRLDTDVYVPVQNNLYQASIDSNNIIQLSLPDSGIYPLAYESGLEVRFICPITTVANQQIQIAGFPAVPLTKMAIGQASVSKLAVADIVAGTLVVATFLQTDDINGAFRLLPSQINDKVSRTGDTMTGNLTLPSLTFTHSTDANKNKKITKYDDAGRNELRIGLQGDNSKDFVLDFAPTVPKVYSAGLKLDLNTTQLKNAANPTDAQDLATKDYVDNSGTRTPLGYIYGLTLANNVTTPLTVLDVGSGITRDATNVTDITLSTVLSKDLNISWAAGNNGGGRFTGVSLTNGTWYHVFVIKNAAGQSDVGFDTSTTAANRPLGYTYYRRVGSINYVSAGSGIRPFLQVSNRFEFTTPVQDLTGAGQPAGVEVLRTLTIPTGLRCLAHIDAQASVTGSGTAYSKVYSANKTQSVLGEDGTMYSSVNITRGAGEFNALSNLSSQVKTNAQVLSGSPTITLSLFTNGWTDLDLGVVSSAASAGTASSGGQVANWALLTYDVPAGTNGGGTNVAGAWTQRTLNTEIYDTNNVVALTANQFTLQPGKYILESWQVFAYGAGNTTGAFKTRIRDVTNNLDVSVSTNSRAASPSGATDGVIVITPPQYVSVTATTTYQLEYYAETALTNGLGLPFNTGTVERYSAVCIRNADTSAAALPPGHLSGLTLSNNVATPVTKLDIAAGVASDSTGVYDLRLSSLTTKLIDSPFLIGNNQGGLASNLTLTNATWYHVFIISNGTTADIYFDSSSVAINRPSGYTYFRRIGSVYYIDGASGIRRFYQANSYFYWVDKSLDLNLNSATITANAKVNFTILTPLGISTQAIVRSAVYRNAADDIGINLLSPLDNLLIPVVTDGSGIDADMTSDASYTGSIAKEILTDINSQICYVSNKTVVTSLTVRTVGWNDVALGSPSTGNTNTNTSISFLANSSANQSIGSTTKIIFGTVSYNVGSYYNSTLSRFQPQVAGRYLIKANIDTSGAANQTLQTDIYFNGSSICRSYDTISGGGVVTAKISKIIDFNGTSDYVEIFCGGGTTAQGTVNTWFEAVKVSDVIQAQTGLLPPGYLNGFTTSNSTVTPLTNIDISSGVASDSTGSFDIRTNSIISKNISSTWVYGSNTGGLATGLTLTNGTWYHLFIISDGANIDAYFDTSLTAANRPGAYKYFRRIASVYYINAGSGIKPFTQIANYFLWSTPTLDLSVVNVGATRNFYTLTTPTGVSTLASLNLYRLSETDYYVSYPGAADLAPNPGSASPLVSIGQLNGVAGTSSASGSFQVLTDSLSRVGIRGSAATSNLSVATLGWTDLGLGTTVTTQNNFQEPVVPYSVNSATTDVNGYAAFINKVDNTTIGFIFTQPIKTCFPDASRKTYANSTQLPNITGISVDGTYTVVEEVGSVYVTTLTPVESYTAPASPSNGQLWLDLSVRPYVPKKWNGSAWIPTQFNKWGEFIRTGGVIPATITNYALNGVFRTTQVVVTNTLYTLAPNIGSNYSVQGYVKDNVQSSPTNETMPIQGTNFDGASGYGTTHSVFSNNVLKVRTAQFLGSPVAPGTLYPRAGITTGTLFLVVKRDLN